MSNADVIKNITLADHDGEVAALLCIMINKQGEPQIEISMPHGNVYAMISALEIAKANILADLLSQGSMPPKKWD